MSRIEYTLSFENYLEMTSSRREKKDFKFAAISAIAGFFCIASGYLFLKLNVDAPFVPGGLLLATGLLLTLVAIILGHLAKAKPSRPNRVVLQREYELYHADQRAIEFDEAGWRVFWYEGEDVRPWSCLRQVHDVETLLILGTATTFYWLPKAALQRAGQLDQLKALAESFLKKGQQLFEVPLKPSPRVYITARMSHGWRRTWLARLLGYGAATLFTYWVIYASEEPPSESWWRIAFVPFLLSLFEVLFYLAEYYKYDWSKTSENAEIMTDCIGYRTKTIRWVTEYKDLKEVREVPGAFLLYFDSNVFYTVPKRGFSLPQLDQFRHVVARAHTG